MFNLVFIRIGTRQEFLIIDFVQKVAKLHIAPALIERDRIHSFARWNATIGLVGTWRSWNSSISQVDFVTRSKRTGFLIQGGGQGIHSLPIAKLHESVTVFSWWRNDGIWKRKMPAWRRKHSDCAGWWPHDYSSNNFIIICEVKEINVCIILLFNHRTEQRFLPLSFPWSPPPIFCWWRWMPIPTIQKSKT